MAEGFFITGTDTDIGKTFVACAIVRQLSESGVDVGVMKPISCGCVLHDGELISQDGLLLATASGVEDRHSEICPIRLKPPLSPNIAASDSGVTIDMAEVWAAHSVLRARHDFMLVEGVGGLIVPITDDYSAADMALDFGYPIVIIARAGLGTINHTLMTIECARSRGLQIRGVVYNGFSAEPDRAQETNPDVITSISGVECLGRVKWNQSDFSFSMLLKSE